MLAGLTASYAASRKQQSVRLFSGVASGKLYLPSIWQIAERIAITFKEVIIMTIVLLVSWMALIFVAYKGAVMALDKAGLL